MTAPIVDLTPSNAGYAILFNDGFNPPNEVPNNTPVLVEAGFAPLYGQMPIGFYIAPNITDSGVYFKKPPVAINCTLISAEVLTNGLNDAIIPIDVSKYVFIANDGRIVFRKPASSVIIEALESVGITPDVYGDALNGFKITASIMPVYKNPTGETPNYAPNTGIIQWSIDGSDFAAMYPYDFIDKFPYLGYTDTTRDTPATITPGFMEP